MASTSSSRSCTSRTPPSAKSWSRTRSVKYHLEHEWAIEDFSFQLEASKSIATESPDARSTPRPYDYCLMSAAFSPPGTTAPAFALKLFPTGPKNAGKCYCGLYIELVKKNTEQVKAKYTLALLKSNGEIFHSKSDTVTWTELTDWGYLSFIRHDRLFDKANGVLVDDVLTFAVKMTVIVDHSVKSGIDTEQRLDELSGECLTKLGNDWSAWYGPTGGNATFADVKLLVDDQQIDAHKVVLSARSEVFKAMFTHDLEEKVTSEVKIEDIDVAIFREFLNFLYTGKVPNIEENALEYLKVADRYAVESLKSLCEEYLASSLTLTTVTSVLIHADMHSATVLKTAALDFIISQAAALMELPNWDAPLEARPKLYSEVFRQMTKAKGEVILPVNVPCRDREEEEEEVEKADSSSSSDSSDSEEEFVREVSKRIKRRRL